MKHTADLVVEKSLGCRKKPTKHSSRYIYYQGLEKSDRDIHKSQTIDD
jgi:hypothetical protein